MSPKSTLRLGTRGSKLARWQAEWVAAELTKLGVHVELVLIETQGDVRSGPIGALGAQGVFTKEIQRALLSEEVDLAVHSLKDLPTEPVPGLRLAAVPPRESVRDVVVCRDATTWETLPPTARVGTGSLRRQAQLRHLRPQLQVADIRGNVDTRLSKLDEGQYDAIVLAEAGMRRLELHERITSPLPPTTLIPAVGQGALGLETREDDAVTCELLQPLCDPWSYWSVLAERKLLATLRGGCLAPVGAWGRVAPAHAEDGGTAPEPDANPESTNPESTNPEAPVAGPSEPLLRLDAVVLSLDGQQRIQQSGQVDGPTPESAEALGRAVAEKLLELGAAELIASARGS